MTALLRRLIARRIAHGVEDGEPAGLLDPGPFVPHPDRRAGPAAHIKPASPPELVDNELKTGDVEYSKSPGVTSEGCRLPRPYVAAPLFLAGWHACRQGNGSDNESSRRCARWQRPTVGCGRNFDGVGIGFRNRTPF